MLLFGEEKEPNVDDAPAQTGNLWRAGDLLEVAKNEGACQKGWMLLEGERASAHPHQMRRSRVLGPLLYFRVVSSKDTTRASYSTISYDLNTTSN